MGMLVIAEWPDTRMGAAYLALAVVELLHSYRAIDIHGGGKAKYSLIP